MKMISSLTVSLMVTSLLSWTNVQFQSKAKKINDMFLGHRPRHLELPASKIFIAFSVSD